MQHFDQHAYNKLLAKPNTVHAAAEEGDIKLLSRLLLEGLHSGNPESVTLQQREDVLGMMPIHIACERGQLDTVKVGRGHSQCGAVCPFPIGSYTYACAQFLIKKRVDLDAGDNFRVTGMHLASIEDHCEIVEELLRNRANVKPFDTEGDLPIHWAATKGHSQVGRQASSPGCLVPSSPLP